VKKRFRTRTISPLLKVVDGKAIQPPPLWFMRQAGRYLPEYREIRAKAGEFLDLCLSPKFATEVTLQPVRRFGLDAAILFSDILVVPHALGIKLWFEQGEGPRLDPVGDQSSFKRMRDHLDQTIVDRVYETIMMVRTLLTDEIALIGFCGAPWTVATYLVAGRGTEDQAPAKELAQREPDLFGKIIDRLVAATAEHLLGQLRAGADVVQIFDTWAGVLDPKSFELWCLKPTVEVITRVRAEIPDARVIVFPKGVELSRIERMVQASGADAVSLDATVDRKLARERFGSRCAVQGNLDPLTLVAGGPKLDREVDEILEAFHGTRHIFNLGHGIRPETPIAHVEQMVARVRQGA
jgi:uroporphyrinogen decarboxylase